MRLIIYGAGGIGCVTGGHLARTGHDVILVGRPGHVQAINEKGLQLITPTGNYSLEIPAVTGPDKIDFQPDDVILLSMKGQNTEEALRELKKKVDDIPIFCVQNGVRNEEIAAEIFPRVYGVMVRVGAEYLEDGKVTARRDPPGWYIISRYPRGKDELAEEVAVCLRTAGFYVMVTEDAILYKWGKLMSNLGNSVGAITNARGREADFISNAARQELDELLTKANVKWISQAQVSEEWPEITQPLRGSLTTESQSSTWQSLEREQGSVETEFLNGEVVRLAERMGLQAPINEMLLKITLEMAENHEHPGKYTANQLGSILGLTP
ncbi:ketopantoate reductase family protein [Chloroflexota bacterium]